VLHLAVENHTHGPHGAVKAVPACGGTAKAVRAEEGTMLLLAGPEGGRQQRLSGPCPSSMARALWPVRRRTTTSTSVVERTNAPSPGHSFAFGRPGSVRTIIVPSELRVVTFARSQMPPPSERFADAIRSGDDRDSATFARRFVRDDDRMPCRMSHSVCDEGESGGESSHTLPRSFDAS
jgi:hypothetical protein